MKTIEWQYLIVCYLFLGGLSAGLFFVSSLVGFLWPQVTDVHRSVKKCDIYLYREYI